MRKPIQRTRIDSSQPEIVEGLRDEGIAVEIIGFPVDLAVKRKEWGLFWMLIECKPEGWTKWSKHQKAQQEFCETHGIPIVKNLAEALAALEAV